MQPEYIHRQEEESTAKDLYDGYNSGRYTLPMLVIVKKGFYDHREETTFSTGQVLRLHELRRQGRALVHDSQKKSLSVPLDYTHRFTVGRSSEALSLREVVERYFHKLPVKISFADPNVQIDRGASVTNGKAFGQLEVVCVHEEAFFLANTIDRGTPLDTVLPIPLYLKEVTFCPVLGIKNPGAVGGGEDGAMKLKSALVSHWSKLAHVDFSLDYSDKEMVQISQKPMKATDDYYANIEQNVYINVTQSRRRRPSQSQQHQHDDSGTYEDVISLRAKSSVAGKADDAGDCRQDDDTYMNLRDLQAELPPPRPPKPNSSVASTLSHTAPVIDDIYEPVATTGHPAPGGVQKSDKSSTMTLELAEVLKKRRESLRKRPETVAKSPDVATEAHTTTGRTTPEAGSTQETKHPPIKPKPKPATAAKPPTSAPSAEPEQHGKPQLMAKPGQSAFDTPHQKVPPHTRSEPEIAQSPVLRKKETLKKLPAKPFPVASKPSRPVSSTGVKPMSTGKEIPARGMSPHEAPAAVTPSAGGVSTATYTNTQEMAVVKPMQSSKPDGVDKPKRVTDTYETIPQLSSLELTTELKNKRVCDVGEVLDKLGLSKYRKAFEDNRVDGVYLTKMNEQILREDFQMNGIDTIKLMTFIQTGHLPQC